LVTWPLYNNVKKNIFLFSPFNFNKKKQLNPTSHRIIDWRKYLHYYFKNIISNQSSLQSRFIIKMVVHDFDPAATTNPDQTTISKQ
jgi:hypothetical protein